MLTCCTVAGKKKPGWWWHQAEAERPLADPHGEVQAVGVSNDEGDDGDPQEVPDG